MTAKINEGDVMEGIFSLAIGLYIADGKVDKQKLNQLRTKINPNNFIKGYENIKIVENQPEGKDKVSVNVTLRLKAKSVAGAYGEHYQILYANQKDIGGLDQKIDKLIRDISSSGFGRKLYAAKEEHVRNDVAEKLEFHIIADGIAGEQTGGEDKGDVTVKLTVTQEGKTPKVVGNYQTTFSLKSESSTVANLSPFVGIGDILYHFGGDFDDEDFVWVTSVFMKAAKTPYEKQYVQEALNEMFEELGKQLKSLSVRPNQQFNDAAYSFFIKCTHGRDFADVIDINKSRVDEITWKHVNALWKNGTYDLKAVIPKGTKDVIRFINAAKPGDDSKTNAVYQLRLKMRETSSGGAERKFYVEACNLAYI